MNARNRWGTIYPYFYCLGRAKKEDCTQSTVLIADVEVAVEDYWSRIQLSESRIAAIREQVMAALSAANTATEPNSTDRRSAGRHCKTNSSS